VRLQRQRPYGLLRVVEPGRSGERDNGDNLLAIRDADVATAFVIETLLLVDHYDFLDRLAKKAKVTPAIAPANKQAAAVAAGWYLSTTDGWTDKCFNTDNLHCTDRRLFGR
jgi:hypothetical protein